MRGESSRRSHASLAAASRRREHRRKVMPHMTCGGLFASRFSTRSCRSHVVLVCPSPMLTHPFRISSGHSHILFALVACGPCTFICQGRCGALKALPNKAIGRHVSLARRHAHNLIAGGAPGPVGGLILLLFGEATLTCSVGGRMRILCETVVRQRHVQQLVHLGSSMQRGKANALRPRSGRICAHVCVMMVA